MVIDIIFLLMLSFAAYRGLQKGFIGSLFSLLAFIVALAAAIKLSAVCAHYFSGHFQLQGKWLPFVSFALVFACGIILIHYTGKLFEKTAELMMMGWLNKLGGVLLYLLLYGMIYSILLFYGTRMKIISAETIQSSVFYHFLEPIGPSAVNWMGNIIPFFKNLFGQLERYFEALPADNH